MRPPTMVPEKPRKSRLGRFTHCTGMRNGLPPSAVVDIDGFEMVQQRRPVIPGRVRALGDDVVAEARGDRDRHDARRSRAAAAKRVKSATIASKTSCE